MGKRHGILEITMTRKHKPKRTKLKNRNPIAKVVTKLGHKVIPDKRKALRMKALDDMVAESERLGLYD